MKPTTLIACLAIGFAAWSCTGPKPTPPQPPDARYALTTNEIVLSALVLFKAPPSDALAELLHAAGFTNRSAILFYCPSVDTAKKRDALNAAMAAGGWMP